MNDVRALTHRSAQRKLSIIFAGVSIATPRFRNRSRTFWRSSWRLALVRYPSRPKAGRWSRQTIPSATDTAPIWPTSPRSQRIAKLYGRDATLNSPSSISIAVPSCHITSRRAALDVGVKSPYPTVLSVAATVVKRVNPIDQWSGVDSR